MASFREKIQIILDIDTTKGTSALKNLSKGVRDADTTVGKFKAGAKGAFGLAEQYAGQLALAGGGALVAFGVKAVAAFQDAALAAGQFADSTGLSSREASKWISVADDYGLSADTLQRAFLRLNKELGEGSAMADKYGVSAVKAADGTNDVNATMLLAIERIGGIKDPTERAAAAQELFGRSYADVAEIILGDSDKIVAALESTSEAQIFDDDEVAKARDFRRAMDEFNDAITDVTLNIGGKLVPQVTEAVDQLGAIREGASSIPGPIRKIGDAALTLATPIKMLWEYNKAILSIGQDDSLENLAERVLPMLVDKTEDVALAEEDAAKAAEEQAAAAEALSRKLHANAEASAEAAEATRDLTDAQLDAVGSVRDLERATIKLDDAVADYKRQQTETTMIVLDAKRTDEEKRAASNALRLAEIDLGGSALDVARAYAEQTGASRDTTASASAQVAKLLELKAQYPELAGEIDTYIGKLRSIPGAVPTNIQALIDQGSFDRAEYLLNLLARQRTSTVTAKTAGGARQADARAGIYGAEGGIVNRPTVALIGEAGPEAVIPLHRSPGNGPLPSGMGAAPVFNLTVNAGMGADGRGLGRLIVEEINRHLAEGGARIRT